MRKGTKASGSLFRCISFATVVFGTIFFYEYDPTVVSHTRVVVYWLIKFFKLRKRVSLLQMYKSASARIIVGSCLQLRVVKTCLIIRF